MKILILHSGGLDSTVCLIKAIKEGHDVISLGIDYGQRHKIEMEYAKRQCLKHEVTRKVIRMEWDKPQRELPTKRSVEEIRGAVSTAFLPGRNLLFFSIASVEAAGIGADEIWAGVNCVDFSGYPDCTPAFVSAFQNVLSNAIPGGPKLQVPLLHNTKPEIAAIAKSLGIGRGETWSCYQPKFHENGVSPCDECDACVLHRFAWDGIPKGNH